MSLRLGGAAHVFAQIESRYGDGPFADPVSNKIRPLAFQRDPLSGGDQRPGLRKTEGEIVISHGDAAVGIPGSAGAHVKQAAAGVGKH